MDPDVGNPALVAQEEGVEDVAVTDENTDYYDADMVFMFHSKSENKVKPGKGTGEKIPKDKMGQYTALGMIDNWRRKLDDYWMDNIRIKIDSKEYASVEHYYQASKFKNGFPKFAELFSLDSKSDISTDVKLCRKAGGKTGTTKKTNSATGKTEVVVLRPKTTTMDPDFYPNRCKEEREKAVMAKFTQNIDMGEVLKNTKRAKLVHYIAKNPPEVDYILMRVRASIL
jgi:hypothetical protein